MIRYCRRDDASVAREVKAGHLDYAHMSTPNRTDDILSSMNSLGILHCMENGMEDIRANNHSIPFRIISAFALAAKMNRTMSITDIPVAIRNHKLLAELGVNLYTDEGDLDQAIMTESGLRYMIQQYDPFTLVDSYNNTVQQHIMPMLNLFATTHLLDCTNIEVKLQNSNYEWSTVCKSKKTGKYVRGYKLANLRGIRGDNGFIEDIRFGQISNNDLKLSQDMLFTSPVFHPGDNLICDRGFIDRATLNHMKLVRGVDTYQPLSKNMVAHKRAVEQAIQEDKWFVHPNKKRPDQRIAFVPDIGRWWKKRKADIAVAINACVVREMNKKKNKMEYFVFITTDLTKSAKEIVSTYELRPKIEEQYRQLKESWKLENFHCKKLSEIVFHVVFTLLAYLCYEIYTTLPEGADCANKSLPVILKNEIRQQFPFYIFYIGFLFGIYTAVEENRLYAACGEEARKRIDAVLSG